MLTMLFFFKSKRTWHDYNDFERKMWVQLFMEKTSELQKQFGFSLEWYKIAKRYADQQLRCLG
ncbi:hypothetical protein ACE1TI_00295 [Alteribacillus sp. JSM 102045]|uniref:hypothetical protein n=1 Tax=Alteribacillus sp. JSM 102045 TaxID=1562101 RepID=UPI0035BF5D79